jgi:hypothetical protein
LGVLFLINDSSELELRELHRITEHISVLIDSERTTAGAPLQGQRQAFLDTCVRLGMQAHALDRRATENYFTDDAVRSAMGPNYRAPGPYERLAELSPGWAKSENWRIARELRRDELEGTDLGDFLGNL